MCIYRIYSDTLRIYTTTMKCGQRSAHNQTQSAIIPRYIYTYVHAISIRPGTTETAEVSFVRHFSLRTGAQTRPKNATDTTFAVNNIPCIFTSRKIPEINVHCNVYTQKSDYKYTHPRISNFYILQSVIFLMDFYYRQLQVDRQTKHYLIQWLYIYTYDIDRIRSKSWMAT